MKTLYPVVFTKETDGYSAEVPDLSGCFSDGSTFAETYKNIQNAIGLYLEDMTEYPKSSAPETIKINSQGQFMCVVEFDDLEYKKQNSTRSVKKNLTIPEWLNNEAEKHHINFSSVLQEALKTQLHI